jgi:hypothetical protein
VYIFEENALSEGTEKIILSVNGKKMEVSSNDQTIDKISSHLPPDVAALLSNIQNAGAVNIAKTADQINISKTSPSLNLKDLINGILNKNQAMVRSVPEVVQRAQEQQKALEEIRTNPEKRLTIYECGVALGIILNTSTKQQVADIMKEFSRINFAPEQTDLMFFYSDISVTVFFNDDNLVTELQFGDNYRGETTKGLKIGDSVEKAVQLYGPPRMKTPKGAIWQSFGVFCQYDQICTIRLQK